MNLSYQLTHVCGNVFENGNLAFTPDGNSVISPVGNRSTVFDLLNHTSTTLPFENRKNISKISISNDGRFLVSIDVDGHGIFINLPRRVELLRHHFKRKVYDFVFSPNDKYFIVTYGHSCQIWKSPNIQREFSPLALCRNLGGFHDDVVCTDWSSDSTSVAMGSNDLSVRVFFNVHSKNMALTVLSGHRDKIVNVYFSKDNLSIYTIARDGAIFTWKYERSESDQTTLLTEKKRKKRNKHTIRNADETSEEFESDDDENAQTDQSNNSIDKKSRPGTWTLQTREFLWEPHTEVSSTGFNKATGLLVVGFTQGVFGLYEMPGCQNIHRLSVSHHSLNTACINSTGEWLALGSTRLGQLLVWEWKSESYVLKQQGHIYGLSSIDISDDGHHIATGGEDAKVKLWNSSSGFCFSTFTVHLAPVTGVKFIGHGAGRAILSSSLDGTVRAHDLLRYRNFKTLTTPTPTQFTCLAADVSGEVVCAGALEPFNIYVWSLQTGHLIDVLAGHEGPIACLDFSSKNGSMLSSGSWDGTLKIWDVYRNSCSETMEHGCDVLALAFRPDGKEICTAVTNGGLYVWDVETGQQIRIIEGRRDIAGGRLTSDRTTAANSSRSKYFTCVVYSADGSCVLAGGKSKYICIYAVATGTLLKKFCLSHNRSLEGIQDELRSDRLVDGVALDGLGKVKLASIHRDEESEDEDEHSRGFLLNGGKAGKSDGSRITRPDIHSTAVKFSATGREWAVATTQGLQIFGLDEGQIFAPLDLDITVTPQAVLTAIASNNLGLALMMALQLGEPGSIKTAVDAIPLGAIELLVSTIDTRLVKPLLKFLATELTLSRHIEYYLRWCHAILLKHGTALKHHSLLPFQDGLRALLRAISAHEKIVMKMTEENQFLLEFLNSQIDDIEVQLEDDFEGTPDDFEVAVEDIDSCFFESNPIDMNSTSLDRKNHSESLNDCEDLLVDKNEEVLVLVDGDEVTAKKRKKTEKKKKNKLRNLSSK